MTLNQFDIDALTYPELRELKERVATRMEDLREQGVPALRERFAEEAAALGATLEEVAGGSPRKKSGRPRKARPDEQNGIASTAE